MTVLVAWSFPTFSASYGGSMEFRKIARVAVTLGLLGVFSGSLDAHHGNAAYESAKEVTITGIVTEWLLANPHCFLKVDVKDGTGNVQHWVIEIGRVSCR